MTVVVNPWNLEEEKVLLAFLYSLGYDYQPASDSLILTADWEKEIIRRDKTFAEGKTSARDWSEIKKELGDVYR
jgi:hypothetical protein